MAFVPASSLAGGAGGNVFVTNFPAVQPVSGTVAATQGTSPWVVDVDNFPASMAVTGPLTNAELRAAPVDVTGTVDATIDSLPLPDGAATEETVSDIALTAILQREGIK